MLHLLGYDHKKKKDTILMRLKEKQLLSLIDSI
ncbi:MAG: rRNA maturation RNAse YbeY [Thermodesulfobacteriota bacterium]